MKRDHGAGTGSSGDCRGESLADAASTRRWAKRVLARSRGRWQGGSGPAITQWAMKREWPAPDHSLSVGDM